MEEKSSQNLGEEVEGKRSFGRPSHEWEDNIQMDLKKIGYKCADWIHVAVDMDQWLAFMHTVS
jgi:hypothetical protein